MTDTKRFKKNFLSVLATKGFLLVLKFGIGVLTARVLGPAGKGIFVSIFRLAGISATTGTLSLGESLVYFIGKKDLKKSEIIGTTSVMTIFCTILVITVLYIFQPYIQTSFFKEIPKNLFIFIYLLIPLMLFNEFGSAVFKGLEKFATYNYISLVIPLITIIMLLFAFYYIGTEVKIVLICFLITTLINTLIDLVFLLKYSLRRWIISWKSLLPSFRFGLVTHLANLFNQLEYQFDVFLLLYFLSPSDVGIYSVGVTVAQLLWYITNSLNTVLFPKIASMENKNEALIFMKKTLRYSNFICLLAAVFLLIFAFPLVRFFYGKAFINAYWVVVILIPGIIADVIFRTLFSWFKGIGKPIVVSSMAGLGFIVNVCFNFLLIPQFGLYGAALASVISYSAKALLLTIIFMRKTRSALRETLIIQYQEIKSILRSSFDAFKHFIEKQLITKVSAGIFTFYLKFLK